jgi:hypothetical protein
MARDPDDNWMNGPVVVRRVAYDAGMKLEAAVTAGERGPAFEIAWGKMHECHAAGDATGTAFWEEVHNFLMERESVDADVETIILEEGETYKPPEDEEIR